MSRLPKVLVYVPAFNEAENIEGTLDRAHAAFSLSPSDYEIELWVIDDGSTDGTGTIARCRGVNVHVHERNLGLGAATRSGLRLAWARGAAVAVKLDADLQHDPAEIDRVIRPILEGKADLCWGSRFKGAIYYQMPAIRRWGNRFFTVLMRILTGYPISDAQTGLFALGRRYLEVFELPGNYNPPQQILLDARFKRMRYAEVPVSFYLRLRGRSFVSWRYPFFVVANLLRVYFRRLVFRRS